MQHNHRKPQIPLPPALPRLPSFSFPQVGRDAADAAPLDPLDVSSTLQRAALRPGRARKVVRKKISADTTEEVQVEDILLEVYAEDAEDVSPPSTRRSPGIDPRAGLSGSSGAHDSIAMAIASSIPPPPAQSAAVDALLRASDPAFAPFAHGTGADYETPSVGPMMMATVPPPAAHPVRAEVGASRAKPRPAALAIWGSMIVVLGLAVGGGSVLALRNGTYARLRDSAKTAALSVTKRGAPPKHDAAPPPASAPAPASATPSASAPPSAPGPVVPTVSVDSLPKPAVAADASLVTFPSYAEGHRVFLDGRVLPVAPGTPTTIPCGRHMLKIGSTRKPRIVEFACGREVIVQ